MPAPMPDKFHDRSSSPVLMVNIAEISIPEERQRKNAKADATLIASIRDQGLLNPIIIHEDKSLVAGERRLDAFRQLGLAAIPCRIFEELSPIDSHLVELQENMARKSLTWQEEVAAIAKHHSNRLENFPGWTQEGTANDLEISPSHISRIITVAKHLGDEDVVGCNTLSAAFSLIEARADRQIAAAQARGLLTADELSLNLIPQHSTKEEKTALLLANIDKAVSGASQSISRIEQGELAAKALSEAGNSDTNPSRNDPRIEQADFISWAASYSGEPFDVIHCDFPYGKNYSGSRTRQTGKATKQPTYGDSADIYFALVDAFLTHQDRFCLRQAHCIFWHDMLHYQWTIDQFTANGWHLIQPYPFIWTKSYQGNAADPKRRPRHCYETALFFSRGDRKLRNLDKDHYEEQVVSDEKLHMSQKPIGMLKHFLNLVVDEYTSVLDPTCGSGTALVAASLLGAQRIHGVEADESHADIARFMLLRELPKLPSAEDS